MFDLLTLITFTPVVGILVLLFLPKERADLIRWVSAAAALVPLVLSIFLFLRFDRGAAGINDPNSFQFVVQRDWIKAFNIQYYMGIDGLSVSMVVLTALL